MLKKLPKQPQLDNPALPSVDINRCGRFGDGLLQELLTAEV